MLNTISSITRLFADEAQGDLYREAFCYALAIQLAGRTPLLEQTTEGITLTLLDKEILPLVKETISDINENIVFDTSCTLDSIRAICTYRYYTAYPKVQPVVENVPCLTAAVYAPTAGLDYANQAFAKMGEITTFLQTHPSEINEVYLLVTRLLQKVNG
jgi:hypothetical protein|nr:MAG TPA: hypothetical protein [Caudoviricetes sp.]